MIVFLLGFVRALLYLFMLVLCCVVVVVSRSLLLVLPSLVFLVFGLNALFCLFFSRVFCFLACVLLLSFFCF